MPRDGPTYPVSAFRRPERLALAGAGETKTLCVRVYDVETEGGLLLVGVGCVRQPPVRGRPTTMDAPSRLRRQGRDLEGPVRAPTVRSSLALRLWATLMNRDLRRETAGQQDVHGPGRLMGDHAVAEQAELGGARQAEAGAEDADRVSDVVPQAGAGAGGESGAGAGDDEPWQG